MIKTFVCFNPGSYHVFLYVEHEEYRFVLDIPSSNRIIKKPSINERIRRTVFFYICRKEKITEGIDITYFKYYKEIHNLDLILFRRKLKEIAEFFETTAYPEISKENNMRELIKILENESKIKD